jgi:Ca2+-binding EF-hand superfamily protein
MRIVILAATTAAALLIGADFASAQAPAPAPGAATPSAADILKQWDTNKDGTVSKDEWTAAGRPAERFDMVDANKDGKITAEELATAMAAMRQRQGQ